MMKRVLPLLMLFASYTSATAQVSLGGQPLAFNSTLLQDLEVQSIRLQMPDMELVEQQDEEAAIMGDPPRYAVHIPIEISFGSAGEWVELKGGARVWRLRLEAPNALATTLLFDEFSLPQGSRLYVYNDDRTSVIGAFSSHNNEDGGTYATQLVLGDACTIEYYEPGNVRGQGQILISHLGYAYRYIYPPNTFSERGGSQPCEVDINCSEGNNWQDEKRGVLGMSIATNFGSSWCTASLVNNTSLNCKNYILSAMHCTESSTSQNFGQYVFYFNYESSGCGSGSVTQNQTVTGVVLRADSDDGGGSSGSDFALMEYLGTIPSSYNAYYNGWNAQNVASTSGVGIHHPAGDRKKISTFTTTLQSTQWGSATGSHWRVFWAGTANGHGVTEGGSSGSPLFDNQGRIVGTLTGGGSFCNQVPNPSPDQYGKMSYHWTSNPGDDLKVWLDPTNTGQLTLSGTYAPCTPALAIDAGISAIDQPAGSICTNSISPVVTLTNYGSTTLTSVNIHYNVDGVGTQIFTWSGSLGTNQSTSVSLPTLSTTAGPHTFNAFTMMPNGQNDQNNANNADASSFTVTIADTYVTLVINTDNYGGETTWSLTEDGGGVVASGGPYTTGQVDYIVEDLCVQSGQCYTFVINDSEADGICCGFGVGNYSLGDAQGISINTGGEFQASETTQFCIPSSASTCDTLYDPFFANASGFRLYSNSGGGYIAGSNSFGDLAKAQAYQALNQPAEVTGMIFWIGAKEDGGGILTGNLYELNGQGTDLGGATNSAPGTVLASATKALERIDTSGFFNRLAFTTPVTVSGPFAVGLDFSAFGQNDEIGIVTNTDGDANNADNAWEKWSNGNWYSMNEAWDTQNDADFDLAIFPVVCIQNVTGLTDLENLFNLFPNPTDGQFFLVNSAGLSGRVEVYSAIGQLVQTKSLNNEAVVSIDISGQSAGIYHVRVTAENGFWTSKVVVR